MSSHHFPNCCWRTELDFPHSEACRHHGEEVNTQIETDFRRILMRVRVHTHVLTHATLTRINTSSFFSSLSLSLSLNTSRTQRHERPAFCMCARELRATTLELYDVSLCESVSTCMPHLLAGIFCCIRASCTQSEDTSARNLCTASDTRRTNRLSSA